MSPAQSVMKRIEALGQVTDEAGRLTRTFGSPAMSRANALVASWMAQAGMTVRQDGIGNVIGRYAAVESPKSKVQSPKSKIHSSQSTVHSSQSRVRSEVLLLGSHLDTVRDAGKFDGALGVLVAIACVQDLHDQGLRLPFALEVVGLADEEGVRFQS